MGDRTPPQSPSGGQKGKEPVFFSVCTETGHVHPQWCWFTMVLVLERDLNLMTGVLDCSS